MGYNRDDRLIISYDSEFTGLHRDTTLISIGMISMSGSFFYAEFTDFDKMQLNPWLKDHVVANLQFNKVETKSVRNFVIHDNAGNVNNYSLQIKNNSETIRKHLLDWLKTESEASGKKVQILSDCYAYDWMLLNDLLCENGEATNLPDYIDYIPIDLSSLMWDKNVDPDITREVFADENYLHKLAKSYPFNQWGLHIKHNSLWDACVSLSCFTKLTK